MTPGSAKPASQGREVSAFLFTFVGERLLFGLLILAAIAYLGAFGLDMAEGATLQVAFARAARQTVSYLGRVSRGDWGMSTAGSATYAAVPVAQVVPELIAKSLGLLGVSLVFATLTGGVLGVWAAKRRHTGWSLVTLLVSTAGMSVPSFFAALLFQIAAIRWTRTFGSALLPVGGFGWDERIILPALVLAARPIAQIARVTSISVGQALDQDFVRTAHSKGLPQRLVMSRHVVRNAAIPILTTVGMSLRFSLSSLPVVEFFFSWTGMGFTLLKAIAQRDDNLTLALILCLGILFILVNVLLEVLYRLIDPRLRGRTRQAARQERDGLLAILRSLCVGTWETIAHTPLWRRLRGEQSAPEPSPFQSALQQRGIEVDVNAQAYREERRRSWFRGTLSNLPFMVGLFLLAGLIVVVVSSPAWTPHSPYTKRGLEYSDGKLTVPPFAPDETYPWGTDPLGRDVMSLVLSGAQQTLLLAALVVSTRVALGFVLGAVSGWLSGTWVDRALLALAEIVAAFPTLLLAMTLILALGIQRGLTPFVVALSFVGWGEMMQFVRGEVMAIRVRPFIESAVAAGLRTPRIIWSHVLPNLLSSLISLAALEMGAALMLLGELGFVGIFIGGGAFAELHIDAPPYHYSDVPEWGALLSNVRLYARTYPWTAIYPTVAFFVAILGFNLFGEGIRRMVETVGIRFTRLFNRYTLALALVAALSVGWAKGNTGAVAYCRRQAGAFDGEQALAVARSLADPSLEGRALGTVGQQAAADRIAGLFQSAGLQPGGEGLGFFQERARSFEAIDPIPQLALEGKDSVWTYREDYVEYPGRNRNIGRFTGDVRILVTGGLAFVRATFGGSFYKELRDLELGGDVVMALSDQDAFYLQQVGLDGILVVTGDDLALRRRYTLSSRDPTGQVYGTGRRVGQETPILWISETAADRMLESAGQTVAGVRLQTEHLQRDEVFDLPTDVAVSMQVEGIVRAKVLVRHVIGHLPGYSDSRYGGMSPQTIVVLAQYDSPPVSAEGALYPAANDNASGVAVMVEAVRTMQETGYQPYRTFLFIAYSGEGLEGGELVNPSNVRRFLQARSGFAANLDVEAIVHLRGLGAGEGDELVYSAMGSRRLAKLLQTSAKRMGVPAHPADEAVDISIVFEDKSRWEGGQEAPEIVLNWEGWESTSRQPNDTPEALSADKLAQAGRALTLALMIMGREIQY